MATADAERLADLPCAALSAIRPLEVFRMAGATAPEFHDVLVVRLGGPYRDLWQPAAAARAMDSRSRLHHVWRDGGRLPTAARANGGVVLSDRQRRLPGVAPELRIPLLRFRRTRPLERRRHAGEALSLRFRW